MSELEFEVANNGSQQTLAELELWNPPQGTIEQLIPIDLDLRFDEHIIRTPTRDFTISLSRADIQMVLEGLDVVRGSRFGDKLNESYVVADLTRIVKENLETETETGVSFDAEISKNIFGKLCAVFKRRRTKKKQESLDNLTRSTVQLWRLIARPDNRWRVVEPVAPHLLKGRYLGIANGEEDSGKSTPLCLLRAKSFPAVAKIFLRAGHTEFVVRSDSAGRGRSLSRNKEAVISQIAGLSLSAGTRNTYGVQETPERSGILLCLSELRCRVKPEVQS